jgi:Co/Zn/Cd efflux system component
VFSEAIQLNEKAAMQSVIPDALIKVIKVIKVIKLIKFTIQIHPDGLVSVNFSFETKNHKLNALGIMFSVGCILYTASSDNRC